jgi:hypothetical protein
VYPVQRFDYVGSDGKTHAGPLLLNPLVVNGPGHKSWAYAFFYLSHHSSLHDQVALQDGNGVAIFEASPVWHVLKIGVGCPRVRHDGAGQGRARTRGVTVARAGLSVAGRLAVHSWSGELRPPRLQ